MKDETDAKSPWCHWRWGQLAMTIRDSMAPRMNELAMLAAGQLHLSGPGTNVNAATGNWFKLLLSTLRCLPSYCIGWKKNQVTDQIEKLLSFEQPFAFSTGVFDSFLLIGPHSAPHLHIHTQKEFLSDQLPAKVLSG